MWTDALQYILMMAAILSVMYLGNDAVGGIGNTWAAAERGQRLEFFKLSLIFFTILHLIESHLTECVLLCLACCVYCMMWNGSRSGCRCGCGCVCVCVCLCKVD